MDIQYHDNESPQLKSQRNARLPVFRLSADVLLAIFFLLRCTSPKPMKVTWDWETIVKVCGHWRSVAVRCPGLWSDITTSSSLGKIRAFLERSKRAVLDVYIDGINPGGDANVVTSLLKGHMWRVRKLAGIVCEIGMGNTETLLLGMTERSKVVALRSDRERITKTVFFLDLHELNPNLQLNVLSLNAVSPPCSCSIYHGLLSLRIVDESQLIGKPSFVQFRNILENCPNLRRLELDGVWPVAADDQTTEQNTLILPHLESIELNDIPILASSLFFAAFAINEDVDLSASFVGYDIETPNPQVLPTIFLKGRKGCKKLHIDISNNIFTIKSKSHWNGTMSDTSISIRIPGLFSPASVKITKSTSALLQDSFWRSADVVLMSFNKFNPSSDTACMNNHSWGVLLDGLPRHTRALTIKIYFEIYEDPSIFRVFPLGKDEGYYTVFYGFPEALSDVLVEPGIGESVRLPELEQLTIIYDNLSEEDAEKCHEYLLELMEQRSMHANRACVVRVEGSDEESADFEGVVAMAVQVEQ